MVIGQEDIQFQDFQEVRKESLMYYKNLHFQIVGQVGISKSIVKVIGESETSQILVDVCIWLMFTLSCGLTWHSSFFNINV